MLLRELKLRLRAEYTAFRSYLVSAALTAEDMLNKAYEVAWKLEIVCLFEGMSESHCRYSDVQLSWIMDRENALDFLYEVWQHTDYLLTAEFADLLYDELTVRKDGLNE